MNVAFHELSRVIAGKSSIDECNAYELKQLANQYPYFGPVQLLLAKKLKQGDLSQATQQFQRTLLYFPNQSWFEHLMNDEAVQVADTLNQHVQFNVKQEESPITVPVDIVTETVAVAENSPASFAVPVSAEMESPTTYEEVVNQNRYTNLEGEEDTETAPDPDKELIPLNIPSLKIEPLKDPSTAEFSFEPYHTVDYFASQGIQVRDEEKPVDKFSQQLKSFTDWLKTMKRVAPTEMPKDAGAPVEERKVEQMAERSITDREVVTEAMAEVWEKQGNHEKAVETYRKLSLLDPPKSSYFAAKIDQLKNL